jgi:formate transporter
MINATAPKEYLSPEEMGQQLESIALKKISYPWWRTFVLAILGGIFISFGAMFATTVGAGTSTIPYGLSKLLAGVSFSLGLILVIIGGAELFTGSTIVSVGIANKKISLLKLIKNWAIVYSGNFVGSVLIALLMFLGKQYMCGNAIVGLSVMMTALTKLQHSFIEAMALGILCNMLVCLAIWLSYSTKSIAGKIIAMIFPITAFVAAGFEHSVANMYFVPMAWLIKNFDPSFVVNMNVSDLTWSHFLLNNLIPVTVGNIIGGVAIWLTLNFLYKKHA